MQTSNKIRVKNLPPAYDEQHLQMFFEYDKGRIGQPVKTLTLNRRNNSAIIEFESSRAVDVVLRKRPITIMDKMLKIDVLSSYLEDGEKLESVNVKGIPEALGKELMRLHLDVQNYVQRRKLQPGDKVKVLNISNKNPFFLASSGIGKGTEGTVKSIVSDAAVILFPSGEAYRFSLNDIELLM